MPHAPLSPSRPSPATVTVVAAIIVGLIVAGLLVGSEAVTSPGGERMFRRVPPPPRDTASMLRRLGVGSVTWYACALAIAPLWWLAYRFPVTHQRPWRAVSAHLGAVAALVLITALIHHAIAYRGAPSAPPLAAFIPVALVANSVPLVAAAALVNLFEARRRAVRGALEAQRLRAQLAESRLAAVTSQLQPHFLFNTLQSISTLIHRDPVAADAMLARLSDLLRDVLRRSRSTLVPLGDELRMIETYLDLARLRFGDRVQIAIDVDRGVHGALLPVLLLQPLLENALQHGLGRRAAGGRLGIVAREAAGRLSITVWDDGVGLAHGSVLREGTGLTNTRERLHHAFGDDQSLSLSPRPGGGVDVTISAPLRLAPEETGRP